MPEEDGRHCFVIMPFSQTTCAHTEEYWNEHFESFLKPLVKECSGLEAHRSEAMRGDIVGGIIMHLIEDDVVIADLTDKNPNVYWELGVRQSFRHGTITIAEVGTDIPFDISRKGIIFYHTKSIPKLLVFRKKFTDAIQDCLNNKENPDSHVLEAIGGRSSLFQIVHHAESIRWLDALVSECKSLSAMNMSFLK